MYRRFVESCANLSILVDSGVRIYAKMMVTSSVEDSANLLIHCGCDSAESSELFWSARQSRYAIFMISKTSLIINKWNLVKLDFQ